MKKYQVRYEFRYADVDISDGKRHIDYLDNKGEGFTFEEAERIACEVRASNILDVKWAEVFEMEG